MEFPTFVRDIPSSHLNNDRVYSVKKHKLKKKRAYNEHHFHVLKSESHCVEEYNHALMCLLEVSP